MDDPDSLPFPLDVSVNEPGWENLFHDGVEEGVVRALRAGLEALGEPPDGELSIALVSDQEIAELNARYRSKDGPTNVLSFPSAGPAPFQGDIVVALQTLLREAAKRRIPARDHATHLLVHGFLHLQGYDHMEKEDAAVMEALETQALATIGIPDPYVMRT